MDLFVSDQDPSSSTPHNLLELNSFNRGKVSDESMTRTGTLRRPFCSYQDASASGPSLQGQIDDATNSSSICPRAVNGFVSSQDPSATLPA